MNVRGVNDVRQTEIHTAEPQVPELSAFEFELAIGKLKGHKSPGADKSLVEIFKAGSRKIRYETHKFINSICNKEELCEERKESIIIPIYKIGDNTHSSNYRGVSICQMRTKFYTTFCFRG